MVDVCVVLILMISIALFVTKAIEYPRINKILTEIKYIGESINSNDKLIVKMATQINRIELEMIEMKVTIDNISNSTPPLRTGPGKITSKAENEKRLMKENRRLQEDGEER